MQALKVLVVVMGVLIVGGTVTLVALIVQRVGGGLAGGGAGDAPLALSLDQPPGTRIGGIAGVEAPGGGGGALAVLVTRPDGAESVVLVDTRRGRVVGEVRAAAAAAPSR